MVEEVFRLYKVGETDTDYSTQRPQPCAHVAEVGIHISNPGEQLACLGDVASSLIEVCERIRPTKVMDLRTFGKRPSLFEKSDRIDDALAIGERTGHHDATFRDDFGTGRDLSNFSPAVLDESPLPKPSIAISKHRQLITGFGDLPEGLQFLRRQLPLLLPVQRQSVEFANGWHGRSFVDKFLENLRCISETILLEMLRGFSEPTLDPLAPCIRDGLRQLGANLFSQVDRGRVRTAPNLRSRSGRRIVIDDLDNDPLLDSSIACRTTFGIDGARLLVVGGRGGPSG